MARIEHKDILDRWTPQATFTVGGANTDPTNLTVRQRDPAGTETVLLNNVLVSTLTGVSAPVAKTATGVFRLNPGVSLTSSGHWFVKFEGRERLRLPSSTRSLLTRPSSRSCRYLFSSSGLSS